MKTTTAVAMLVALAAAACADKTPANDPSTTSATDNDPSHVTTASTGSAMHAAPSSHAQSNDTTGSSSSTGASSSMGSGTGAPRTTGSTTGSGTMSGTMPSTPAPDTMAPAPAPAAANGAKPDNTKMNERDRKSTLTPIDQGNSGPELKITAAIRKAMVGSKSLSFNAKNAKVITTGTKVTLRGPVKSDEEKAEIEKVAKATEGVTDVDNQLEVKK